jgi:hypothetical protein
MIKIKVNEKTYGFERDEVEQVLLNGVVDKLKATQDGKGMMMRQTVKSALTMIMPMMGIKKPKEYEDMDNIEFMTRFAVTLLLEELEKANVELTAKEVE